MLFFGIHTQYAHKYIHSQMLIVLAFLVTKYFPILFLQVRMIQDLNLFMQVQVHNVKADREIILTLDVVTHSLSDSKAPSRIFMPTQTLHSIKMQTSMASQPGNQGTDKKQYGMPQKLGALATLKISVLESVNFILQLMPDVLLRFQIATGDIGLVLISEMLSLVT